jgi:hypothetical protein
MMQVTWRASLVVVLLLLASVGTASAECAWVLWSWNWDGVIDSRTIEVFDTQRECERFRRETEHDDKKLDERLVKGGWKPISPYRRACFPDTIDPRGPKGR